MSDRISNLVEKALASGFESPMAEYFYAGGEQPRELGLAATMNGISHAVILRLSGDVERDDQAIIAAMIAWYKERGHEPPAVKAEAAQ